MKNLLVIFGIIFIFQSCSQDQEYFVLNGRVERAINVEGVADQAVRLQVL